MTVYFFTKENRTVGSSRQRAFLVAEVLQKHSISTSVCTPPIDAISTTSWPKKVSAIFAAWKNLARVGPDDIIFLQRATGNKYFFFALVIRKLFFRRKFIFDFDDATFLHSPRKTKFILRHAEAVIAGSHALAEWARSYNDRVYLIPTLVDHERYRTLSEEHAPRIFTIGWIGNAPAHYENLKLLVPVFVRLVEIGAVFRFRLVGCLGDKRVHELFSSIPGIEFECVEMLDWSDPHVVPDTIHLFSVGVMPLIDSEWNRGKCAFKAIEYMAAGIPAIVSPVGENSILVTDRLNGFIASNTEEWVSKILELYNDDALGQELGRKGAENIRERYSFAAFWELYREIILSSV